MKGTHLFQEQLPFDLSEFCNNDWLLHLACGKLSACKENVKYSFMFSQYQEWALYKISCLSSKN